MVEEQPKWRTGELCNIDILGSYQPTGLVPLEAAGEEAQHG